MNLQSTDSLILALGSFREFLNSTLSDAAIDWREHLHSALEQLANAVQAEIKNADQAPELVGEINPDFQNAPSTDRHFQTSREQLIQLREQIFQLRATIRNDTDLALNAANILVRAKAILANAEIVRRRDDEFMQSSANTELGSGE